MSEPIIIQSDSQHGELLDEAVSLMEQCPPLGSPESDRLLTIATAVEEWESKYTYPLVALPI